MSEISFRLIRNKNSHLDIDKLEECDNIDLSNCNIDTIDNLELFTHLKELNLSHNRITRIENLSLFYCLDFLDISSNSIDVAGLKESYEAIPKTLATINLSGNPCVLDENALCDFQDRFPEINIIIDILNELEAAEEDKEQIDSYSNLVDANHGEDADYNEIADISKEPLTSDSVLKYIVDRKCKLQALGARFNLTSAVEELDMEYSKVIETREQNISSRRSKHAHDLDVVDETLSRYKARADEIVSRTAAETSKFSDFMSRLKASAASHKGQILADRGGETVV